MNPIRQARICDEIRRILADIVAHELKDPRIPALTSITDVKVSGDLGYAKCYVSVPGGDEQKQDGLEALVKARGFLRAELAGRMRIRTVPELRFLLDDSVDRGMRIDHLIDEALGR